MKSLVIGGNGFIGTNLVDALLLQGHEVRVYDRYPSRFREPNKEVEYVVGDLGNHGAVQEVVEGIDFVFHLASTSLPHTSNEDPIYDIRTNLVDTVQLLQSCTSAAVSKIVFVSSGGTVYGVPQESPIKETHTTDPVCSYGITKLAIEKYLQLFYHLHGLDYVVARVSNPYGEQQNPNAKQGAVTVFLGNVKGGQPITIWGTGEVVRDYIYIGDTVKALVCAAQCALAKNEPRVFNVGAGRGYSLNQLIDAIKDVVQKPVEVRYTEGRPEDVPANVLDISRAKQYLNWQPEISLNEGLTRTWSWLQGLQLAQLS
ncbi:MAG TPA: NAD-dependent epimerase/dehydratase family protein [Chroococcales cyanobacterium]